jgi:hypothetical protein
MMKFTTLNAWAVDWIALCVRDVMKNYTHLPISGQVTYLLWHYLNRYRYSNQGWEFQNSQKKYMYMHMTNIGGPEGTSCG